MAPIRWNLATDDLENATPYFVADYFAAWSIGSSLTAPHPLARPMRGLRGMPVRVTRDDVMFYDPDRLERLRREGGWLAVSLALRYAVAAYVMRHIGRFHENRRHNHLAVLAASGHEARNADPIAVELALTALGWDTEIATAAVKFGMSRHCRMCALTAPAAELETIDR